MTSVEFDRGELERLVNKLLAHGVDLSEDERELLLAIFWAAGDNVYPGRPHAAGELEELRKQLIHSFLRDTGTEFRIMKLRNGP